MLNLIETKDKFNLVTTNTLIVSDESILSFRYTGKYPDMVSLQINPKYLNLTDIEESNVFIGYTECLVLIESITRKVKIIKMLEN